MTDLDDIYSNKIMELAAAISHTQRLDHPDATASAHSKLCGSHIDIELKMDEDRITAFSQDVKACLLGQVAASITGREIVGTTASEFRQIATAMHDMLKRDGPAPEGRWADLSILEPVKDYHARHASALLVFDAVTKALDDIKQRNLADAGPEKTK